jgi:hypothetical protein
VIEITIGQYGRMMFEMMTSNDARELPKHWASIRAEAEPLVRQLIALNARMSGSGREGGYTLTDYTENGKPVLSAASRIDIAQIRLWGVKGSDLKVGDRVWVNGDLEESLGYVEFITEHYVCIDMGRDGMTKFHKTQNCLRAPADFRANEDIDDRFGRDYWLARADELGI